MAEAEEAYPKHEWVWPEEHPSRPALRHLAKTNRASCGSQMAQQETTTWLIGAFVGAFVGAQAEQAGQEPKGP